MVIVSSDVVGSTITFWNLRSKAPSFSIELRYSLNVVAPIHWIVPRANAGFNILAASIEPGVEPAPISVCISSIKITTSGFCSISLISARIRSSNCPRYFVPATIAVISRLIIRLLNRTGDVWCLLISWARPSTIALLPTPGSPIKIGLFFFLRHKISTTRWISRSRPTTGSSFPSDAHFVKSVPKLSSTGVFPWLLCTPVAVLCGFDFCELPPLILSMPSSSSSLSGMSIPSFVI